MYKKYFKREVLVIAVFLLFLSSHSVFLAAEGTQDKQNVIWILVDTLRADHLGCYGYHRNTTPNIDEFAKDSIVFKNAFSTSPWTTASIGSMLTSQYPTSLGITSEPVVLNDKFVTLAELFKAKDYMTIGIVSCTYASSMVGFDQGFDGYDETEAIDREYISSPGVTRKTISFLEQHKDDKFFLFVHYFDPHMEYFVHPKYNYYPEYKGPVKSGLLVARFMQMAPDMTADDIKFVVAAYDSEISFTDEHIGKVFTKLKELGLYDDALIIFTSDHGEELLEREDKGWNHERLYNTVIHIPFIIKLPGNSRKETIGEHVSMVNLMPTIAHLANLNIPNDYLYEGKVIDIDNKEIWKNEEIFSETKRFNDLQSIIKNGKKFIKDFKAKKSVMFDIIEDFAEKIDISQEYKTLSIELNSLLARWDAYIKMRKKEVKAEKPNFSKEQIDNLRSLGYIQ